MSAVHVGEHTREGYLGMDTNTHTPGLRLNTYNE